MALARSRVGQTVIRPPSYIHAYIYITRNDFVRGREVGERREGATGWSSSKGCRNLHTAMEKLFRVTRNRFLIFIFDFLPLRAPTSPEKKGKKSCINPPRLQCP